MKTIHFILLFIAVLTSHPYGFSQNIETEYLYLNNILIERIKYNPEGLIFEQIMYYDENHQMKTIHSYKDTLLTRSDYYFDDIHTNYYNYTYDDMGRLTAYQNIENDSIQNSTLLEYKDDLLHKETSKNAENTIITEYEYNEDYSIKARIDYIDDADGMVIQETYFQYDTNGNITQSIQLCGIDTSTVNTFEYDEMNRCISWQVYSNGELLNKIVWEYYKNTELIRKATHYSQGYIVRQEKYKYHTKGLLRSKTITDYRVFENMTAPKKEVYIYRYTFYE